MVPTVVVVSHDVNRLVCGIFDRMRSSMVRELTEAGVPPEEHDRFLEDLRAEVTPTLVRRFRARLRSSRVRARSGSGL